MRLINFAAIAFACAFSTQAFADSHVFIIANQPDDYGIDQCLANGADCGASAARAYCQSREFAIASGFRRVDPAEVTGALPAAATESVCQGSGCAQHVAITCER